LELHCSKQFLRKQRIFFLGNFVGVPMHNLQTLRTYFQRDVLVIAGRLPYPKHFFRKHDMPSPANILARLCQSVGRANVLACLCPSSHDACAASKLHFSVVRSSASPMLAGPTTSLRAAARYAMCCAATAQLSHGNQLLLLSSLSLRVRLSSSAWLLVFKK
jgi:hypothetical protein